MTFTSHHLALAASLTGLIAATSVLASPSSDAPEERTYYSTKTPYVFTSTELTPAPPGFTPVFVQYVGRHGSRHLSSAKYDKTLFELLEIAEERGQLTDEGRVLKDEIARLMEIEQDVYGELSRLGGQELHDIGVRLAERFPEVFAEHRPVIAHATYKART
ncbi:histidine phosphatase family protein, partial [Halomonas sp. 707D4]|nr:histidine phosphatase family protein [Halomonas sp. 707D4]